MAHQPVFGEERRDRYYKAAESLRPNRLVKAVKRPTWGVNYVRSNRDVSRAVGVTLEPAKRGQGLWVRFYGATEIDRAVD